MTKATLHKWLKRIALDLVIICLAQYGIMLILCFFFIDAMMFAPQPPAYTWQTPFITNIGSQEKPLAAYWHPASNATVTILHSHGNAEEINDLADIFELLVQTNINVLAYDYPGYGLSAGKSTEQGCYQSAETAYAFLTQKKGIPPENIIVLGRSLGSGPACYLAEKYPVKGLILESAFISAPRVVTRYRLLPRDPFPNVDRIKRITCPKLIIHGTKDPVIPFWHGQKLYDISSGERYFYGIQGGGHNDLQLVLGYTDYANLIQTFATRLSISSCK
jgi:fermentation-respiration switch protein FrsA (DUF1100 family)